MDYIEEIFNKHCLEIGVTTKLMMLRHFRAAAKDIEADHLKRVCAT